MENQKGFFFFAIMMHFASLEVPVWESWVPGVLSLSLRFQPTGRPLYLLLQAAWPCFLCGVLVSWLHKAPCQAPVSLSGLPCAVCLLRRWLVSVATSLTLTGGEGCPGVLREAPPSPELKVVTHILHTPASCTPQQALIYKTQ